MSKIYFHTPPHTSNSKETTFCWWTSSNYQQQRNKNLEIYGLHKLLDVNAITYKCEAAEKSPCFFLVSLENLPWAKSLLCPNSLPKLLKPCSDYNVLRLTATLCSLCRSLSPVPAHPFLKVPVTFPLPFSPQNSSSSHIPLTGRAEDSFCALDFFASLIFVQLGGGWLSSNNFLCSSTVCFTPPIRTRKKKICDWDFIAYSAWDTPILSNYFPLVHIPLFLLCKKPLQDFNSVSLEIKISRVTSKPTEESSIKCSPCVL